MKILNLYACLGGNRYKWDEVTDIEVTAVERDPELAKLYQERFPNDTVIIEDAHEYLLNNYKDFDFIWSSPPCPTHSQTNHFLNAQGVIRYPDMKLYQEIVFLQHFSKAKYCIENVVPYYEPLIPAQKRGRHLYWSNFPLPSILTNRIAPAMTANKSRKKNQAKDLELFHEINLENYKGKQDKAKIARNLVDFEAGKTIFETALGIIRKQDTTQETLF